MSQVTLDTLKILEHQIGAKKAGKLLAARNRKDRAKFINLAREHRASNEPIDWDYIYRNWRTPREVGDLAWN